MNDGHDGPEWFTQTPGTYNAVPISWQGWGVVVTSLAAALTAAFYFHHRPTILIPLIFAITFLTLFVTVKTTRGGWRWRRGL